MLNPSTADENVNDPTVERCRRRAEMMGYGGLVVINIFAYRSTDPRELKKKNIDPVGMQNNMQIVEAGKRCKMVICGWGKHGSLHGRGKEVLEMMKFWGIKTRALRLNKDGSPAHPLYIGYDVKPFAMNISK